MSRERNTGWERVRSRRERKTSGRENLREGPGLTLAGEGTGQRQGYIRRNWRDQKDIQSFYFTRFPDEANMEELWRYFKQFGAVREIFISARRNKLGKKYGFVRFSGVEDKHELERKLDNSLFGRLKMHVNIPKFARVQAGKTRSAAQQRQPAEFIGKESTHGRHPGTYLKRGSYAQAVTRNIPRAQMQRTTNRNDQNSYRSCSSVQLELSPTAQNWLREAWVGRLRNLASFDRIEDDLPWDIGANISPKYIGDDMVLLLGFTEDAAKRLMDDETEEGESPFYSLEKWHPRLRTGYRLTWVTCWGIPLVVWDTTQMRKIVAAIGELVDVDDDVDELRKLDRACILIKTSWMPPIAHTVNVHVQGEVYKVHITEETAIHHDTCRCRRTLYQSSSEEIFSDDSEVESPRVTLKLNKEKSETQIAYGTPTNGPELAFGLTTTPERASPLGKTDQTRALLTGGPSTTKYTEDNEVIQRIMVPTQTHDSDTTQPASIGNADTCGGTVTQKDTCIMDGKEDGQDHFIISHGVNSKMMHERGNHEEERAVELSGRQILNTHQSRDCGEEYVSGPGFAAHTPVVTNTQHTGSPNKSCVGPMSTCRVFSRRRWRKKQEEHIPIACSNPHKVTETFNYSPLQQYQDSTDNQPNNHGQTELLDDKLPTKQTEEAESIWKMAQALGVTGGPMDINFVEKIADMEARDTKQAERLGVRSKTP